MCYLTQGEGSCPGGSRGNGAPGHLIDLLPGCRSPGEGNGQVNQSCRSLATATPFLRSKGDAKLRSQLREFAVQNPKAKANSRLRLSDFFFPQVAQSLERATNLPSIVVILARLL